MGAVESVEYTLFKIFLLLFRSVGWMDFKRSRPNLCHNIYHDCILQQDQYQISA